MDAGIAKGAIDQIVPLCPAVTRGRGSTVARTTVTRTFSPSRRLAISRMKLHAAEALLERAGHAVDPIRHR